MADIIEKNEFPAAVPLLEPGDKVEGGAAGRSNAQAIVLAARTKYLKTEQDNLKSKVGSLTANDVGADGKGTAAALVGAHEQSVDPHPQYLSKADAIQQYLDVTNFNAPDGYLKLDANGKIPAALLSLISTEYLVAKDKADRLAITANPNLVIVAQADIDTLFYLNGGLDPSVEANWITGQAATVSGVSRVFGRTGDVVAEQGDYTADQITETPTRLFLSPTDKQIFAGKQDKLVSGLTIKTLFGLGILGNGDVQPTPTQMGCAAEKHTHTMGEITDYKTKVLDLVGSAIKPGKGVTVGYNAVSQEISIAVAGTGGNGDGRDFVVVDRPKSAASQLHAFSFAPQSGYDLFAYALKAEDGKQNQAYVQDVFPVSALGNFNITDKLDFNTKLGLTTIFPYALIQNGDLFESTVYEKGKKLILASDANTSVVPAMTSNTTPTPYTVAVSSSYDSSVPAYKLFDGDVGTTWISLNQPSSGAPQWVRATLPKKTRVSRYQIVNRSNASFINSPTIWTLYGSNDGGATLTVLDTRTSNNNTAGAVRTFDIATPGEYTTYQLNVTGCAIQGALTIAEFKLLGGDNNKLVLEAGGKHYTVNNNALVEVTETLSAAVIINKGLTTVTLTEAMQQQLGDEFKIITGEQFNVNGTLTPYAQIAVPKLLTGAAKWATINSAALPNTLTGSGVIKTAVTRDLNEYFVFESGAWKSIGTLTADTAGATKLVAQGMTPAAVAAITAAQWKALYANNNDVLDKIAFAYVLDITDATTDAVQLTSCTLNVNELSSWKMQTPAEVEIRWYADSITFKALTAGDYKFGYQIP